MSEIRTFTNSDFSRNSGIGSETVTQPFDLLGGDYRIMVHAAFNGGDFIIEVLTPKPRSAGEIIPGFTPVNNGTFKSTPQTPFSLSAGRYRLRCVGVNPSVIEFRA